MNIFALDIDPRMPAIYLDNKRVGKLLMEACQLMSHAVALHDPEVCEFDFHPLGLCGSPNPTKGYVNGPVSKWVRSNQRRYDWTFCYATALAEEFEFRFGKQHASARRLPRLAQFNHCLSDGPLLPFQNSARHQELGIDYTHLEAPESYRQYTSHRWETDKLTPVWTGRAEPEWRQPLCELLAA